MGKAKVRRTDCFWYNPESLVIVSDKTDPLYDPRVELPVNDDLVQNILYKQQGVLEPVLIVKDGKQRVVVDGRQRVRAACRANEILKSKGIGALQIPCVFKRGDSADLFAMSISTNEQRVEDNPLEKAEKLKRLLNQGFEYSEAATIFGVTVETIKRWEKLIGLEPDVKDDIRDGKLSASAASKLAEKSRVEQRQKRVYKQRPRKISEIKDIIESGDLPVQAINALRWVLREVEEL